MKECLGVVSQGANAEMDDVKLLRCVPAGKWCRRLRSYRKGQMPKWTTTNFCAVSLAHGARVPQKRLRNWLWSRCSEGTLIQIACDGRGGGEDAIDIVEEEVGDPLGDIFDQFDYEPIAAASVGT